jgi:hypothetical protein
MVRGDAVSTIVLMASPGTKHTEPAADSGLSIGKLIHLIKLRPLSNVYNEDSKGV